MDKPVGIGRVGMFRLQGWILVARTLAFAFSLVFLCSSLSMGLLFWAACITVCSGLISFKGRQDLLPYCFLASSTMLTGAAVSLALSGDDGMAILFALCLSAVDSSFFVSSGCRGIRR